MAPVGLAEGEDVKGQEPPAGGLFLDCLSHVSGSSQ